MRWSRTAMDDASFSQCSASSVSILIVTHVGPWPGTLDAGVHAPFCHLDRQHLALTRVRSAPTQSSSKVEALQDVEPSPGPPAGAESASSGARPDATSHADGIAGLEVNGIETRAC